MSEWVSVEDEVPGDHWMGLILSDVRPDKPVFAHTADATYRRNFPYADYFIGRWREALLIGDHLRDKAKVTHWWKADHEPWMPLPREAEET